METKKILDKNGLEYYTGKIKQQIPKKTSDLTNDSNFIDNTYHDSSKQDTLVSGTNIKTINNTSILGSGNINIETKAYIDNSLSTDSTTHGASVHAVNVGLAGKISSDGSVEKIVKSDTEPTGTEATIWIEPSDFKSTEINILKDTLADEDLDKAPTVHAVKQAIDNVENIDYDSLPVRSKIEYTKENQWENTPSGYVESTIPYTLESVGEMADGLLGVNVYHELGKEKIVGIWIDGKPIYRKVINFGSLPNAGTKNVAHNISNLDNVINARINARSVNGTGGTRLSIPYVYPRASYDMYYIAFEGISNTHVTIVTGNDRTNYSAYVILEYTKTTDTGRGITISGGVK